MNTVLLIDDEKTNHFIIEKFFQKKPDFRLEHAYSGEEGIALLLSGLKPDLILLDAMMEGIDGFETASKIRHNEESFTPIIMLTALADSVSRIKAVEVKINDFITKPIDFFALDLSIKNLIELKKLFKEIHSYQKFYQKLVNSLSDIVIVFDNKKEILFMNSIAKQFMDKMKIEHHLFFKAFPEKYPDAMKIVEHYEESKFLKDSLIEDYLRIENMYFQVLIMPFSTENQYVLILKDMSFLYQKTLKLESDLEKNRKDITKALYIQKNLMSKPLPLTGKMIVRSLYVPSFSIGGDFHIILREGHILAGFIADVSGHGIEAALYGTMLFMAVERHRSVIFESAGEFLNLIDQELSKVNMDSNFITAFAFRFDLKTKELFYANAGHNVPYYSLQGKKVKYPLPLEKSGPPLGIGINPNLSYLEHSINLNHQAFRLIFYTDGLIEDFMNQEAVETYEYLDKILYADNWYQELENYKNFLLQREDHADIDDTTLMMLEIRNPVRISAKFYQLKNADVIWEKVQAVLDRFDYHQKEKERIFVLIQELVSNAVKYASGGELTVKINGGWVMIRVKDEGSGFDVLSKLKNEKCMETQIEDFFLEKALDYHQTQSCGLGLLMAYKLSYKFLYNQKGNTFLSVIKKDKRMSDYCSKYENSGAGN